MQLKSNMSDFFGTSKLKLGVRMRKPKLGTGARFKGLVTKLTKQGSKNPKALAAYIGRKKYGKSKFQALATSGRKRKS